MTNKNPFTSVKKRKNRLGAPPSESEAGNNLNQPEHAPAEPGEERPMIKKKKVVKKEPEKMLGIRVPVSFIKKFKGMCVEEELSQGELLQACFEVYLKK